MRYINRQKHKSSCIPVAICNIAKWLGQQQSYQSVLNFCLNTSLFNIKTGIRLKNIDTLLGHLPWSIKPSTSIWIWTALWKMKRALRKGRVILLVYSTNAHAAHGVFVSGLENDKFIVWNKTRKKPSNPKTNIKQMKRFLRNTKQKIGSIHMWIIKKD